MRRLCCIAALAACTPPQGRDPGNQADGGANPIDATPNDSTDPGDAVPIGENRLTTAVIVGSNRIVWSRGAANCPDLGCPENLLGSTVLSSELSSPGVTVWLTSEEGVELAGDENEVFYVSSAGQTGSVLTRLRLAPGEYPQAISVPRWDMTAVAVDPTHVYWFERTANGISAIRRTSRAGDGSDAVTVATGLLRPPSLVVFGGYVFFSQDEVISQQLHSVVFRVPVTGGTPERVTTDMDWSIIALGESVMYVDYPLSPMEPPYPHRIVTMTVDGTMQTLAEIPSQAYSPHRYAVLDRGELFWIATGGIFQMPAAGGTPSMVGSIPFGPFGVTADSIVYNFTTSGYETIPR